MRRFRLRYALLLAAVVLSACAMTWLFVSGLVPQAVAAGLLLAVCLLCLAALVGRLVRVMSTFVSALEADDTTVRFDFTGSGAELRRMGRAMNRIVELYRSNKAEIEQGKLYYDRILKVMTNEMRNSVTPVIALADELEKHPDRYSRAEAHEALGLIRSQSESIKRFLDAYFELTHIPEPAVGETDAADFFGRIRSTIQYEARSRGLADDVCRFTVAKDMRLNIDTGLMAQAMVNLLRNALDAVAGTASPRIDVTVSQTHGHPYITVKDNGCGIAPGAAENLFMPFFTTKPGGCGVGLCLSRQIVRRHGGDIRLIATASPGALFAVTLL